MSSHVKLYFKLNSQSKLQKSLLKTEEIYHFESFYIYVTPKTDLINEKTVQNVLWLCNEGLLKTEIDFNSVLRVFVKDQNAL